MAWLLSQHVGISCGGVCPAVVVVVVVVAVLGGVHEPFLHLDAGRPSDLTDEIIANKPQLEHRITSLDKV